MKVEDIKLYYEYNDWANNRILDAAEHVSPEQLTVANDLGWGSLLGALVHTLDAESGWFSFLFGGEDSGILEPQDFPDIPALRKQWDSQNKETWRCLNTLQDEDLSRIHTRQRGDRTQDWVLWQTLVHVVNHGTQHRSECAALLTSFGRSPGDMDFTLFLNQRKNSA